MAKIRYNLGRIAFNDRGVYSNSETYVKWDFVTSVDSTYLYINESAGINKLINDPSYWKCIADGKPSTLAAAAANLAKAATIQATSDANDAAANANTVATNVANAEAARVLAGSEVKTNKTSDIETNKTSVDKYPTIKGVVDYVDSIKMTLGTIDYNEINI